MTQGYRAPGRLALRRAGASWLVLVLLVYWTRGVFHVVPMSMWAILEIIVFGLHMLTYRSLRARRRRRSSLAVPCVLCSIAILAAGVVARLNAEFFTAMLGGANFPEALAAVGQRVERIGVVSYLKLVIDHELIPEHVCLVVVSSRLQATGWRTEQAMCAGLSALLVGSTLVSFVGWRWYDDPRVPACVACVAVVVVRLVARRLLPRSARYQRR